MTTYTITELDTQVELLPARETLWFDTNWAAVYASNSSLALNAANLGYSSASSAAGQAIYVVQG